jgi:hypothetical protein
VAGVARVEAAVGEREPLHGRDRESRPRPHSHLRLLAGDPLGSAPSPLDLPSRDLDHVEGRVDAGQSRLLGELAGESPEQLSGAADVEDRGRGRGRRQGDHGAGGDDGVMEG